MRASAVAWTVAAASVVLAVVDTALVMSSYPLVSVRSIGIHGWPLVNIAALGSAVIGAATVSAHSRHPIGWLLTLVGLTTSISLATESYGIWVLNYDGHGSAGHGHLATWVAALLGGPLALACLSLVFLLVPAGRFLSPRWRWVAVGAWAGYAANALGLVLVGPQGVDRDGEGTDADAGAQALLEGGVLLITLMILASVLSMVLRLRRSTGVARTQVRIVATGAAAVGLALAALLVGQGLNGGRQSWQTSVPLYSSYAFLIVCVGVAVLRFRLYDVEVIISRALLLAFATALVAAGYVGAVVTLGRTVEDRTGGGFWWSLLATVVVAVAFQPARRYVVRVADRLAYGQRAAPYDALAEFSRRIGRSPATGELLPTVAAAAGEAAGAARSVVRLSGDDSEGLTATWLAGRPSSGPVPARESPEIVVPIRDASGELGSILLTPRPGRDVRRPEQRLLSAIAEQAALALRNMRLQIELAARVEQLGERTRELTASRNRIIGAADAERRRLEAEIARSVLPALVAVRSQLPGAVTASVSEGRVAAWVQELTQALESLRELTRGVYPTMLARSGLVPTLTSYAARVLRADALRIGPAVMDRRFPDRIEATAYFCCAEVLGRSSGDVALELDHADLVLSIEGVSLQALNRAAILDRVEACAGSIDSGTALLVRLPAT